MLTYKSDIEELAKEAAGNWRKFDSFAWFEQPEDSDDWTIVYTHNRDSDIVTRCNAEIIEQEMTPYTEADEPDCYAERHNHWAVGWVDGYSIRVYKNGQITEAFKKWCELQQRIEDYPLLDESKYSEMEWNEYLEAWELWGRKDFIKELEKEFCLFDSVTDFLDDIDNNTLREFYEELYPNETYYSDNSGINLHCDLAAKNCLRDDLAIFIKSQRRLLK